MYILFEELSDFDSHQMNIVATYDDLKKINDILSQEDILDFYTLNNTIIYTPRNDMYKELDRRLILVKVHTNTQEKVLVS